MSKIWSFMIIISVVFSFFCGNADKVIEYISNACANSIENIITLTGMLCFWTGIFNVLKHTSIVEKLSDFIKPIVTKLLRSDEIDEEIMQDVSLNITSNAIGIGNAATAFSVDAIKKMQQKNGYKKSPNNSMTMFILLNTASIQIIPTTIISLRAMYGSKNPSEIILAVWIVTFSALISGAATIKVLNKVIKQ